MTTPKLNQAFQRTEAAFYQLRFLYLSGQITTKEFESELKKLRVQDEEGKYWTLGAQTGKWYCFDGQKWMRAEPPFKEGEAQETEQSNWGYFSFPGINQEEERKREAPRANLTSGVSSLNLDLMAEAVPDREKKWNISSIPPLPASFFWGVVGTITGIIAGAVVGSTRFFLHQLNFLPVFLQELQGKLTGGLLLALVAGLAGFFLGALAGLIMTLIFNLASSLTGGFSFSAKIRKEEKEE